MITRTVKRHQLFLLSLLLFCQCINCIPLLGGRFETSTDVQQFLNLALDAAEMKESDDFETKKGIYTKGVNRENESR